MGKDQIKCGRLSKTLQRLTAAYCMKFSTFGEVEEWFYSTKLCY